MARPIRHTSRSHRAAHLAPKLMVVLLLGIMARPVCAQAPAVTAQDAIDVETAVRMALMDHPSIEAAHFDALAAKTAANLERSHLLPRLDLSDTYSLSRASFKLGRNFVPGLGPISNSGSPQAYQANIGSIALSQPITGLLPLGFAVASANRLHTARQADLRAAKINLRATIERDFLDLFEVLALADTVRASERSLNEQVTEAKHEVAAGTLNPTDVLRIEAAAANARQQVIAADADALARRAALLEDLGLGLASQMAFSEPNALLAPPALLDVQSERAHALRQRPELQSAQAEVEAAVFGARARTLAMVPEVTVDGSYMHLFSEPFAQASRPGSLNADAVAVMFSAKWNVFSWGGEWYARQEAAARAHAARARSVLLSRQISIEVAERHASYLANASSIEVAHARLESAEEAFRVLEVQVRAGAATTTDLLDVEASRTNARKSLVRARYAAAKAHVELRRAVGQDVTQVSSAGG